MPPVDLFVILEARVSRLERASKNLSLCVKVLWLTLFIMLLAVLLLYEASLPAGTPAQQLVSLLVLPLGRSHRRAPSVPCAAAVPPRFPALAAAAGAASAAPWPWPRRSRWRLRSRCCRPAAY